MESDCIPFFVINIQVGGMNFLAGVCMRGWGQAIPNVGHFGFCWPFFISDKKKNLKNTFFRKKEFGQPIKNLALFFNFNFKIAKKNQHLVSNVRSFSKDREPLEINGQPTELIGPFFFQSWTQKVFFFGQLAKSFGHFWMARFGHFFISANIRYTLPIGRQFFLFVAQHFMCTFKNIR